MYSTTHFVSLMLTDMKIDLNGTDKEKAEELQSLAANGAKTDKNGVKESSLFKQTTGKDGKTTQTLDKDAAAKYSGQRSQGYKDLIQMINNKAVVSVNLVNADNNIRNADADGHCGPGRDGEPQCSSDLRTNRSIIVPR